MTQTTQYAKIKAGDSPEAITVELIEKVSQMSDIDDSEKVKRIKFILAYGKTKVKP